MTDSYSVLPLSIDHWEQHLTSDKCSHCRGDYAIIRLFTRTRNGKEVDCFDVVLGRTLRQSQPVWMREDDMSLWGGGTTGWYMSSSTGECTISVCHSQWRLRAFYSWHTQRGNQQLLRSTTWLDLFIADINRETINNTRDPQHDLIFI